MNLRIVAPLILGGVLLAAACNGATEPSVPTALEIDPPTLTLVEGDTATLNYRVLDQQGRAMTELPPGFTVTWSSDDESVVLVSDGRVTAVGGGETVVRAAAQGVDPAASTVTVEARVFEGSASVDYAGEVDGRLEVASTFRFDGDWPDTADWVFAYFDEDEEDHVVIAFDAHDDTGDVGDMLVLFLAGELTPGRVIAWDWAACTAGDAAACDAFGFLDLNVALDGSTTGEEAEYDLDEGVFEFAAETSDETIAGTFSATGYRYVEDAQGNWQVEGTIDLTDGSVSAPIPPWWAADVATATLSTMRRGEASELPAGVRARIAEMRARR
jgi:hypothetical protein